METEPGKGSLFAALRRGPESPPPPPPPPLPAAAAAPASAPAPALKPVLERLEKLESKLTAAPGAGADKRMADLEARLKETQEQAIKALVSLQEREAAQKAAQTDAEHLMRELSAQRRGEEAERQMREQVAAQRARIDELENRLVEAAAGAGRLDPVLAAQRVQALKVSAFQDRVERLSEGMADLGRAQAATQAVVEALRGEVARLRAAQSSGALPDGARDASPSRTREGDVPLAGDVAASLAELKERLARREAAGEERLASLRQDLGEIAQNWEVVAAELRAELRSQGETLGGLDRTVRGLREATASTADLRRVEAAVDHMKGDAVAWQRTHAVQAELLARLEQIRAEWEDRHKSFGEAMGRFETEMRGLILGRILRLEESLKKL